MNTIARNNVKMRGAGSVPMIFAHGYGCDQEMWRLVEPSFRADYQTIVFDHVGAGLSDISRYEHQRYSALEGYAQDLLEICDELDLKDAIFVGHSVSATIGVLAALKKPSHFRALVLVAPNPSFLNCGDYTGGFTRDALIELLGQLEADYEAWAHAMAPIIMGRGAGRALGMELAESFCRVRPEIAKHFASATFLSDHRADFAKLRHRTLILQCREDGIAPASVGEYLKKVIAGSTLVPMKATGHCPHMSAPEETITNIRSFLSTLPGHAAECLEI